MGEREGLRFDFERWDGDVDLTRAAIVFS